ncbi:MAG: hypothetical protein QRY72_03480 [Candidatus Rhabdochlamydia sp.]
MQSLGIIQDQAIFRWALLKCRGKKITIEAIGEGITPPFELLNDPHITVATALSSSSFLCKDFKFPLTSKALLQKALRFQLEMGFSLAECQVVSDPTYQQQVIKVTSWIVNQTEPLAHMTQYQALGIDPDQIILTPLALTRWIQWCFPRLQQGVIDLPPLAIVLDEGRVICCMHGEDRQRLLRFTEQKYPLFPVIDHSFFITASSPISHAIPIGAALETFRFSPCQFRATPSSKKQKQEKSLLSICYLSAAILFVAVGVMTLAAFTMKTYQIHALLTPFPHLQGKPYETVISSLRHQLIQHQKKSVATQTAPSPSTLITLLSSLQTKVIIERMEYKRVQDYPHVTLEFQAKNHEEATAFLKQLQQIPMLIPSTCELKWTLSPRGYKVVFPLQKVL